VRALVTGGAGYIGSHLVDRLRSDGHDVRVLDDLSTGKPANLAHCRDEIEILEGSILDAELVSRAVKGTDLVFHLAAAVGVTHIVRQPLRGLRINVEGTQNVVAACTAEGVKMVLASTSEVYGRPVKIPMSETDDRVLGPTTVDRWSYSTAKALDEHLLFALHREEGFPMSIVRYFNSYGPRLADNGYGSVVARFVKQALAGGPITVYGDGSQSRSFTYVSDTVEGTYRAGTQPGGEGEVFNIGNGAETSILQLAQAVGANAAVDAPVEFVPYEKAYGPGFEDTARRVPDVSKAASVLGWRPQVSLADGLRQTIDWWRANDGGSR
jgi:UDP-glucose 4-epimerase